MKNNLKYLLLCVIIPILVITGSNASLADNDEFSIEMIKSFGKNSLYVIHDKTYGKDYLVISKSTTYDGGVAIIERNMTKEKK